MSAAVTTQVAAELAKHLPIGQVEQYMTKMLGKSAITAVVAGAVTSAATEHGTDLVKGAFNLATLPFRKVYGVLKGRKATQAKQQEIDRVAALQRELTELRTQFKDLKASVGSRSSVGDVAKTNPTRRTTRIPRSADLRV